MPRGSKPGERRGGRKKGTENKRTQALKALADKALEEGVTPLEVMLTTMRGLWAEANADPKRPLLAKRMQAVVIAEKVAPYVHPKLAAVTAKHDVTDPVKELLARVSGSALNPVDE
jgi:hypothetical protein